MQALKQAEANGDSKRANDIRTYLDYKKSLDAPPPSSKGDSADGYRASVEAASPLDDPAFVAWAKKRGVAPTTQKRNEYDKAMADTLKNRLGRWIKGVSVNWVNSIAPEEGGDVRAAKIGTAQVTRPYLKKNNQATNGALLHSGNAGSSRLDQKSVAAAHSSLEQISSSLQNPSTKVKGMVDSLLDVLDGMKSGKPVSAGGKPLTAKNFVTSMQILGFKRGEGAKSAYYTVDGDTTTKTSDHSANAELFVQDGTANNLSIVIRRPHDRKRFNKDNSINVIEAVFPRTDLESNPEKLAQIIRDIGEFIATGEYHDTAGAMAYNFSGDDAYQAKARDILYLDAVKRGDMETAMRMVREAAAKTDVVLDDGRKLEYNRSNLLYSVEEDEVIIENIETPREQQGKGNAKKLIQAIIKKANQLGLNVTGYAYPQDDETDIDRLRELYTSQGAKIDAYDLFTISPRDTTAVIKSVDPVTYDDNGNVIPLSQRFNASSNDIRYLHDGERIVGSYNRATGEVNLAKGASVETVLHELGWHAARHWAEVNADSDPRAKALLEQMKEYAETAPKEIKDAIRDVYGDLDADTLLDEIGAARFAKEQSGKIAKALATKEGAAWYQKVWDKVVDFYKNFLTKIGYNRVDLDGIENMSPDVFGDFLADAMMSGKQLGERTAFSMEAPKGLAAKWTNNLSDYKAPIAELEKRTTGSSNNIYYLARTLEGMAQRGKNRAERAIKRVEKILGEDTSPELLAQYMQLKAYEERNAKIERRNGKADASGMTPEDARTIEKTIDESGVDEAIFEEAAQILWDLQKEGLQARVDAGLLDQETANKWMTDEPHHIPWKDAVDPDSGEYVGRRMGASEFDTAEGRKTAASGDPITWMLQEYQDAMTRAAQNRLRSSIANLTRLNGDVGTIYDGIQTDSKGKRSFIKYPKKGSGGTAKVLSIPEGVKTESTVKNDGGMKNVLTFKEGGETKYLVLNGSLGEAVAGAVTGRTLARPIPYLGAINRFSSATATTFSWAFAAKNYKRDTVDARNNFIADFGNFGDRPHASSR